MRSSPLRSSRSHTLTMSAECLRWWMSHRLSVCTLCWELLSSDSFRSSAASENADMPGTTTTTTLTPHPARPRRSAPAGEGRGGEGRSRLSPAEPRPRGPAALTKWRRPHSRAAPPPFSSCPHFRPRWGGAVMGRGWGVARGEWRVWKIHFYKYLALLQRFSVLPSSVMFQAEGWKAVQHLLPRKMCYAPENMYSF